MESAATWEFDEDEEKDVDDGNDEADKADDEDESPCPWHCRQCRLGRLPLQMSLMKMKKMTKMNYCANVKIHKDQFKIIMENIQQTSSTTKYYFSYLNFFKRINKSRRKHFFFLISPTNKYWSKKRSDFRAPSLFEIKEYWPIKIRSRRGDKN